MWKDFFPQDSYKDFNFKLKYNGKPFFIMSDKAFIDLFQGFIFFFFFFLKKEREELFFISPGNRSQISANKFEILSIPYCVVRIFFRVNDYGYLSFIFLKKKSWFPEKSHSLLKKNSVTKYWKFFKIFFEADLSCFKDTLKACFC